jgi:two-component system response regulator DegU
MKEKINVIVTDDHNLFRKGMMALISDFDFIGEIYEAGNGLELLDLLDRPDCNPDVILLDIRMPEVDGIEAHKKIKELFPEIKVIILSMEDDEQIILHLVEQGVNGYMLKNADPDEVENAFKKVMRNDFYFSTQLSGMLINNLTRKKIHEENIVQSFTEKEIKILELICKQYTAAEIGEQLNQSVRTIEGYRRKLLEKTNSKNLAGLVVFALKNNLVSV